MYFTKCWIKGWKLSVRSSSVSCENWTKTLFTTSNEVEKLKWKGKGFINDIRKIFHLLDRFQNMWTREAYTHGRKKNTETHKNWLNLLEKCCELGRSECSDGKSAPALNFRDEESLNAFESPLLAHFSTFFCCCGFFTFAIAAVLLRLILTPRATFRLVLLCYALL